MLMATEKKDGRTAASACLWQRRYMSSIIDKDACIWTAQGGNRGWLMTCLARAYETGPTFRPTVLSFRDRAETIGGSISINCAMVVP
jgi:hypothetical protein